MTVTLPVRVVKASKEAGRALLYEANAGAAMAEHHHHLLHCLEKTTVSSPATSFPRGCARFNPRASVLLWLDVFP